MTGDLGTRSEDTSMNPGSSRIVPGRMPGLVERLRVQVLRTRIPVWALVPSLIGLASRAFSLTSIATMQAFGVPKFTVLVQPVNVFTAWDGQWYLWIASHGYQAAAVRPPTAFDYAFFPLWPILIKIFGPGVLPSWISAVLLANGLFILAGIVVWRLLADVFGDATATRGTALFAFAPPAFVFSMVYTESLFILLAAASLLATRRLSRWAWPAALLAGFTRITAVAIAASAFVRAMRSRGRARSIALGSLVATVLALVTWSAFIMILTGDWRSWIQVGTNWQAGSAGPRVLLTYFEHPTANSLPRIAFVVLIAAASVRLLTIDLEMAVYALGCVGLAIAGASWSLPRYAMVAFPAFGVLAIWGGRRGTLVLLVISVLFQAAFVWMSLNPDPIAPP
jgi:hypothetical protein